MFFPPSLPPQIVDRAFKSANGELGLLPADANDFLDACQAAGIETLGWELWCIDHALPPDAGPPFAAPGEWCGLIPVSDAPLLAVVSGDGGIDATRLQLADLDLNTLVDPIWRLHIRVNFTLNA